MTGGIFQDTRFSSCLVYHEKRKMLLLDPVQLRGWISSKATWELIWVKQLLCGIRFRDVDRIKLYFDDQAVIQIASNSVFHERKIYKTWLWLCLWKSSFQENDYCVCQSLKSSNHDANILMRSFCGHQSHFISKKYYCVLFGCSGFRVVLKCFSYLGKLYPYKHAKICPA
jgi:hypothetical protein